MQEFLSGSAFEQMAREYNLKYNNASALQSNAVSKALNFTKEKEKNNLEVEKTFNEISSLLFFTKKHIERIGIVNFNKWGNFYFVKLNELEKKFKNLKERIL